MSGRESAPKNGHANSSSAGGGEQQPGPSTGRGTEEQQTKTTARSPALNFNAHTPSSSTELCAPGEQQQRSAAAAQPPPQAGGGGREQQQQQQLYQRWPGDLSGPSPAPPMPSSSASVGPPTTGPAPVLISPHYSLPPHIQQQYQQHHLGATGALFYGHQLGTAPLAPSQHSPGQQRHYTPPQLPQMFHPGMVYHHQQQSQQPQQQHMVPQQYQPQQHYGAVQQQQQAMAAAAYWARTNGQHQMPTPPAQDVGMPCASTSARHTPQPSSVPPPNPSPVQQQMMVQSSPSTALPSAHGTAYDESNAIGNSDAATAADAATAPSSAQRPRSQQPNQQPQQPSSQQPPPNAPQAMMLSPQAAAAHLRYSSAVPPGVAMMVAPPTGPPLHAPLPQQHQQQLPYAAHPQMGPPAHPAHMAMPPMHHHHYMAQGPPPPFPGHPPPPPHPGMYFHPAGGGAAPPGSAGPIHHPSAAASAGAGGVHGAPHPSSGLVLGMKPGQREAVEKLVMQLANTKQQLTAELVHERRLFFERLVLLNEQQGEVLSGPPQVSKSTVDLYSLYFAVKKKGGFEKTIKDKVWKHMCMEANADMQESSAAGFQLRKHYQKYLLKLECLETGQNAKELVEFAEKQKKKKKEKEQPSGGVSAGGANAAGPSTPSSSKEEQPLPPHQQQGGTRPSSARGEHSRDGTANTTAAATTAAPPKGGASSTSSGGGGAGGGQPQQQQQHSGAGTPQGVAAGGGADFGQYAASAQPFGQYPPPQWATAFHQQPPQGMYPTPPRMAPPTQQQMVRQSTAAMAPFGGNGNAQAEDEQQRQQSSVSSRLPTPAQQSADQRPISRASSAAATGPPGEQLQRDQQDERGEMGAAAVQQQPRQAQTPSSAFSANAPTPPLTTASSASGVPSALSSSAGTTAVPFYHPGVPYGVARYPPAGANDASVYGPPGAGGAMYSSPQQLAAVVHQQRLQQQQQAAAAAASASARYYAPMPGVSPSAPMGPQQQQQPQKGGTPSSAKTHQQQQPQHFLPPPASFYAAGARPSATAALLGVVPPQSQMLPPPSVGGGPAGVVPPAAFVAQQQPYAVPSSSSAVSAWHHSAAAAQQLQHQFPASSLEAQVVAQVQQQTKRRRDKVFARDLYGASSARIVMALRSALHTETVWALNALNVQLYDDTALPSHAAPSLAQTPELLNLLVDHMAAALSLLFPDDFTATPSCLNSQRRRLAIGKSDGIASGIVQKRQQRGGALAKAASSSSSSASVPSSSASCSSTTKANYAIANGGGTVNGGGVLLVPKQEQQSPFVLLDKVEVLVPNLSSLTATTTTTSAQSPRHGFVVVPSTNGGGRTTNRNHQQLNGTAMGNSGKHNFTMVSRLGRRVKLDTTPTGEMPLALARELQLHGTATGEEREEEEHNEWGPEAEEVPFLPFVDRVRQSVLGNLCARGGEGHRRTKIFGRRERREGNEGKENQFWEQCIEGMEQQRNSAEEDNGTKRDESVSEASRHVRRLFFHRADDDADDSAAAAAGCSNRWHTNNSISCCSCTGADHFSLLSRPVVLQDAHADERVAALVEQCLALSNILRGYAFLPGHERTLAAHSGLLRLLSTLMMLMVEPQQQQPQKRKRDTTRRGRTTTDNGTEGMGKDSPKEEQQHHHQDSNDGPNGLAMSSDGVQMDAEDQKQVEEKHLPKLAEQRRHSRDGTSASDAPTEATTTAKTEGEWGGEEDDANAKRRRQAATGATTTTTAAGVVPAPETDTRRKWLLEVANQLRDDAFAIMAQLSAHLDLFDSDSAISWPIFDALLHWSVSTDLQARDPLPPFGVVSPRHYAFEILCKMSVMERNVDLLMSTGPWPRLEAFVRLLCAQICEEPPVREFAIVILNAVCAVSEPACYIAAVETPLLEHLVSFLEAADANMTQIVQQQGMHALRENPEIIGTSVGMLRRATTIMVQIARHEQCRGHFRRLQHRLLQFTVSHFMDLRVAAMVANILFEIQRDFVPPLPPECPASKGRDEAATDGSGAHCATLARKTQSPPGRRDKRSPQSVAAEAKLTDGRESPPPKGTTPFLHGSNTSDSPLFNGTTTMCSSTAVTATADQICPASIASGHCAVTGNFCVPSMAKNAEEGEEEANDRNAIIGCRQEEGGDGDNKTDTNRRKRMYTNNCTTPPSDNDYGQWNGHPRGTDTQRHTPEESVVDRMPTEKRPRVDEEAPPASAALTMNNGSSAKVRERMRQNILSKKASLKAMSTAAGVAPSPTEVHAVPTSLHTSNKRNNGWIIGDDDDDCAGEDGRQQPQHKKLLLHNGTTKADTNANKGTGGGETATTAQKPSSVSPAGSNGGSSLTAVA